MRRVIQFPRARRWLSSDNGIGGLSLLQLSLSEIKPGSKTQVELVEQLRKNGVVKSDALAKAMEATDRALFVPLQQDKAVYAEPYENVPVTIHSTSKSTMSTPHHHSIVGELCNSFLATRPKGSRVRVLDAGCGTGYTSSLLARLCLEHDLTPHVVGTEAVPGLLNHAIELRDSKIPEHIARCIQFEPAFCEDSTSFELYTAQKQVTFDLIHCGFAVAESGDPLETMLSSLLSPGGRFVGSVVCGETGTQALVVMDKSQGGTVQKNVVLKPVFCQQIFTDTFDEVAASMSIAEKLEKVKAALEEWKVNFERTNGHAPSKQDLLSCELFQEFTRLRKRVWDK